MKNITPARHPPLPLSLKKDVPSVMVGTSLIIAGLTFNEAICALLGGKHLSVSAKLTRDCELRIVSHLRIHRLLSVEDAVADVIGGKHHLELVELFLYGNSSCGYVAKAHSGDAFELLLG